MSEKSNKATIYIDVDDEITGIIDKVRGASGKVVALVLPKRATVLQSVVNMKLLKRTSDEASKHLVLVTSEAGLLPLAGSVGLYVADTPTSKPFIPPAPAGPSDEPEDIDEPLDMANEEADDSFDPAVAATTAVGELAAANGTSKIAPSAVDENIDLDNSDEALVADPLASKKVKKDKKLKVPNFDSFRKKLLLAAILLVLLIGGWVLAFIVLPHATVTIHTDTSAIKSNLNITLDTAAKSLDTPNKIVPAVAASQQKTASQQAPATGQQNNGSKAHGQVGVSGSDCSNGLPDDIPAGTTMSSNAHTYVFDESVSFGFAASGKKCIVVGKNSGGNTEINMTSLRGGADYNIAGATFAISGRNDVSASGSASGGTDNITKVITQSDIDNANAKITAQDATSVKQGLQSVLQGKELQAIPTTFLAGPPQVTTSAKAGDATDTVTVTQVTTYTMLGVRQADLKTIVDANVTKQLDKNKQSILDDGVSKAKFTQANPATATSAIVAVQTTSTAGPSIDTDQIKKQIVGKKGGEIKDMIKQTPGVTDVEVKYSPFWVSVVPKNVSKVTVQVDKSNSGKQ